MKPPFGLFHRQSRPGVKRLMTVAAHARRNGQHKAGEHLMLYALDTRVGCRQPHRFYSIA